MADPYSWYRQGGFAPLPYMIEAAPLALYRTHAQQAQPALVAQGVPAFMPGNYQQRWLPQKMGQTQWLKDSDGNYRRWDASAQSYLTAVATSAIPPTRGGSTVRTGRIAPPARSDRYAAFDAFARQQMAEGVWRGDGGAYGPAGSGASFPSPSPAISRNIPAPQLLPSDLHALQVYEDGAIGAARRRAATNTRNAINEIRALDDAYWRRMRGGR